MSILVYHQINQRMKGGTPLATDVPHDDYGTAKSKIQAASLDLTIGDIFVPDRKPNKPGGANLHCSPISPWRYPRRCC
jgi:hypothetical protein